MALMGKAALAMWWNIDPQDRQEFEHWHSSEHFAERLGVPGFLRGTRWVSLSDEPDYFVMYELEGLDVLSSDHYRQRVDNPTPWSTRTMARFKNMVRSQCQVQGSQGGGISRAMLTLRFSPQAGQADALRAWIVQEVLPGLATKVGLTGAHLLENVAPAGPARQATAEQKIRGGDAAADWVLLVSGYDVQMATALAEEELNAQNLERHGAAPGQIAGVYQLSYSQERKT